MFPRLNAYCTIPSFPVMVPPFLPEPYREPSPQKRLKEKIPEIFLGEVWDFGGFHLPRNFHFYCIFGPHFRPVWDFIARVFRKFSKKTSKNFELFQNSYKITTFDQKCVKTRLLAKFGQKGRFWGQNPRLFKVSAPSAPKLGFFGLPQRPKCGIPSPPFLAALSPQISLKATLPRRMDHRLISKYGIEF